MTRAGICVGTGFETGEFTWALGVARIFSKDDDASGSDTEVVVELADEGLELFIPYAHSIEERAFWLEAGVATFLLLDDAELSP